MYSAHCTYLGIAEPAESFALRAVGWDRHKVRHGGGAGDVLHGVYVSTVHEWMSMSAVYECGA